MTLLFIYIINYYLNKKKYVFELYFFKFELHYKFVFMKFVFRIFLFFFQIYFWKWKLCLKLFFKIFYIFLSIYLYIYSNPKFHIPKIIPHPSTLNSKSRLVNHKSIIVFYPSLKVRIKMVSVKMKNGTMNVLFVAISQYHFSFYILKHTHTHIYHNLTKSIYTSKLKYQIKYNKTKLFWFNLTTINKIVVQWRYSQNE